jgi:hypothetical protein
MGWLPVRWKHKSDEHPESNSVRSAGKPGDTSGTSVMGDPNKGVVQTVGGSSANTVTRPAGPRVAGTVIGGSLPTIYAKYKTCGHDPSVVIVVGCWPEMHVQEWLACHSCQMEALWQVRHGENETFCSCGHPMGDLIYSYLPGDPEYHALGRKIFTAQGTLADDKP